MAIYRKYRRTGHGYLRRGRSGYSMYKLYRKRSSAAQARQIYGLNKKMKRIQRLTRPEINIAPLVQGTLSSGSGGTLLNDTRIFGQINLTNLLSEGSTPQTGNDVIQGRFARIQNVTLKGVFTYTAATTLEEDPVDLQRMIGYLRIVLVQLRNTRQTAPSSDDVFSSTIEGTTSASGNTALSGFSMIRAPLKTGLARVSKVLSDKTYMISDTKQAVNIKTKLRYVKNWYQTTTENAPKGQILMYVMIYNPTASDIFDVSQTQFTYVSKCVYTDA